MRKLNQYLSGVATGLPTSRSIRSHRRSRVLRAASARAIESLEGRTLLSGNPIIVTTGSDDDSNGMTLRDAILMANSTAGQDQIYFANNVSTVSLTSALPAITDSVIINGAYDGSAARSAVVLDGSSAGHVSGLELDADGSMIQGLWIQHFYANGLIVSGNGNLIGGSGVERNIISGNGGDGILVTAAGATPNVLPNGNVIQGNYIGTDDSGEVMNGNALNGVEIDGALDTTINGNVISGNSGDGILILNVIIGGATIKANLIGLDALGVSALGNSSDGIHITGSNGIVIGGIHGSDLNVISGNSGNGIRLETSSHVTIQNNYVGTDASGTQFVISNVEIVPGDPDFGTIMYVGNQGDGVEILGGCSQNLVLGNVVSGNGANGVLIDADDASSIIQGNKLGTDVTGLVALGNLGNGLLVQGGGAVITGNLISANQGNGVQLTDNSVVTGNLIGTDATGLAALGNEGAGIFINGSNNTIGGKASGLGNVIAFNNDRGVQVNSGTRNSIRGNSIFSNASIAIDLVAPADGFQLTPVTLNDSAGHNGANNFQNFAVISSATTIGSSVYVSGSLTSTPGSHFEIDLYSSVAPDASNYGGGKVYLGTVTVDTDASGRASFSNKQFSLPSGGFITATAVDAAGNTSEFCRAVQTVAGTSVIATSTTLQSSTPGNKSLFGDSVSFTATVTGADGSKATGSIIFAITDAGGNVIATYTVLLSNGKASTPSMTNLAVGTDTVTATYKPADGTYSASAASTTQVVKTKSFNFSGTIFNDKSGNGLSADDAGLSGVTVELYVDSNGNGKLDSNDTKVASTTSSVNGGYSFVVATPDTVHKYFVSEVTPTGYVRTAPALATSYTVAASLGGSISSLDFDNYYKCNCSGNVTNISYYVNGRCYTDLRGHTHEGDTVVVKFTVTPGHSETLSLVSYTAPAATFDANTASKQVVYQFSTGTFSSGVHSMTVVVPKCFYQVDFVCGRPIDVFGPANSNVFYSAQGRLYSADNSGTHAQLSVLAATDMSGYNT